MVPGRGSGAGGGGDVQSAGGALVAVEAHPDLDGITRPPRREPRTHRGLEIMPREGCSRWQERGWRQDRKLPDDGILSGQDHARRDRGGKPVERPAGDEQNRRAIQGERAGGEDKRPPGTARSG